MGAIRDLVRFTQTWLLGVLSRNRAVALALLSTLASATVSLALQPNQPWRVAYGLGSLVLVFFIVLTGLTPGRYAAAKLLSSMLPVIHRVLELTDKERLTLHILKSNRRQLYEQLTDYYPSRDSAASGRVFTFSHGIVGQVFKTRQPLCWSVLEVVTQGDLESKPDECWRKAMNQRWGFDRSELASVTPGRHSFMAYPIGQEGPNARAVLFIDSSDPQRFQKGGCETCHQLIRDIFLAQLEEALRSV
jgi:hypothetical protein